MFKNILRREKQPQVKQLVAEALDHFKHKRYEEALAIYERAREFTSDPSIVKFIALTLSMMKRPTETLAACETALIDIP